MEARSAFIEPDTVVEEEVPWRIRVNISMQAAKGLTFLHR